MNKTIWVTSLILLLGCNQQPIQVYTSPNFELVELADGVFACIHILGGKAICNAGIVDNGNETLIFDTFLSPAVAEEIHKVVELYGLSPVRYVVNSHAHNDHVRGNQVFADEVDIISTKRTAELMEIWEADGLQSEREYAPSEFAYWDSLYHAFTGDTTSKEFTDILLRRPYYEVLAESHLKVRTRLPNLIVEEQMDIDGPDRSVQLISRGTGHTEGDLILFLPDDKIVFTGDLVFYQMHPYVGQGDPEQWIEYLDYLESLGCQTVVPGHGPVCGGEGISAMKAYFHMIDSLANQIINQNTGIEMISEVRIPDPYKTWWFDNLFRSSLRFMYTTKTNQP